MPEAQTIPAKYIFLDIVGFTHNRSVEAQSDIIKALNEIVESTIKEYEIKKDEVMFLPAGNDICIALLNVGSPYDIHLRIALSIVEKVYKYSINTPNKMRKFEVRVGINSYTDNLVTDINGNRNLAGAGVNLAAQIMKMADGNQILLSNYVFDNLRHHEKYVSSLKPFRAKIKEDIELPVYQFISQGYEGLNISTPASLRDSATPPVPPKPQISQQPKPQITEQPRPAETVRSAPVGVEKPIFVTQSSITKAPQVNRQTEHTLSYLKGILPEPEKPETKSERIAPKIESLHFLEQSEPNKSRSFVWAFVVILVLSSAALGTWFWMTKQPSPAANQPLANAATPAPSAAPVNSPTIVPNQTQNQSVAQTSQPSTPAETTANSETETKVSNDAAAFKPRAAQRRAPTAPRPIQRTAVQRLQPKPQPARAKSQAAQAGKTKSAKRVTLDDLIN